MQFVEGPRQLSPSELGLLGMQDLAYVKPVVIDGEEAFSVHAADGTQIAVLAGRDIASALLRQHGLEAVSVH